MKVLNKLTTSNYLLSLGERISKAEVKKFKRTHPYNSITDLMLIYDDNYSELRKNCVYTFSSTFSLQQAIKIRAGNSDEEEMRLSNWVCISSFDLIRAGTANRKEKIEAILESKKHLLIQF